MLADLPSAVERIMARVESQAAVAADVTQLMHALPPLANLMRYGSVRQTDAALVARAASGMVARICVGLPLACSSLDDNAASAMFDAILRADASIGLMDNASGRGDWHAALARLAASDTLHGLVAGRCVRILLDAQQLDATEAARLMNLAVSTASEPPRAAAWVEGFLRNQRRGPLSRRRPVRHLRRLARRTRTGDVSKPAADAPQDLQLVRGPAPPQPGRTGTPVRTPAPSQRIAATSEFDIDLERAAAVLPLVARALGLTAGGDLDERLPHRTTNASAAGG